jgi:hypothetical protein
MSDAEQHSMFWRCRGALVAVGVCEPDCRGKRQAGALAAAFRTRGALIEQPPKRKTVD